MSVKSVYTNELGYAWLGNSLLKSVLSLTDSQKVLLRSFLYPHITMIPMQLSLCLLFVPRNPDNRIFKISSSSTHTIGLNRKKMRIVPAHSVTTNFSKFWHSSNCSTNIWVSQDCKLVKIRNN